MERKHLSFLGHQIRDVRWRYGTNQLMQYYSDSSFQDVDNEIK